MGKKLYVGNLPFSTTDESLQEIFAQAGTFSPQRSSPIVTPAAAKVSVSWKCRRTRKPTDAIQKFNGAEYGGRNMTVAEARPMAPREDRGGHRGGGGGGGRRDRW